MGMQTHGMTYKDLQAASGVPDSTLHAYARGKTSNPDEHNLVQIAKAFGDPPEIIQQLRREGMDAWTKENLLIARASDKEGMEQLAALIRSSVLEVMEAQMASAAAQQTEIIQHADQRIAQNEQRCAARISGAEARCAERIADQRAHYEDKIADLRRHYEDRIAENMKHRVELRERNNAVRSYLKSTVRNLSIALIAVIFYAVYAYQVFDREDPTRGLYRGEGDLLPVIAVIVLVVFVGRKVVSSMRATRKENNDETIS